MAGGQGERRNRIVTDPLRVMIVAEDTALRAEIGGWIDREPDSAVILSRRGLGHSFAELEGCRIDLVLIDAASAASDLEALGSLARCNPALPVLTVYPDWPSGPVVARFGDARDEAEVVHGPGALRFAVLSAIRRYSGRTEWYGRPPARPSAMVAAGLAAQPVYHA